MEKLPRFKAKYQWILNTVFLSDFTNFQWISAQFYCPVVQNCQWILNTVFLSDFTNFQWISAQFYCPVVQNCQWILNTVFLYCNKLSKDISTILLSRNTKLSVDIEHSFPVRFYKLSVDISTILLFRNTKLSVDIEHSFPVL